MILLYYLHKSLLNKIHNMFTSLLQELFQPKYNNAVLELPYNSPDVEKESTFDAASREREAI